MITTSKRMGKSNLGKATPLGKKQRIVRRRPLAPGTIEIHQRARVVVRG